MIYWVPMLLSVLGVVLTFGAIRAERSRRQKAEREVRRLRKR